MTPADIGEYCRRVEDHLTRSNEGHLVRIAGPAFELVRGWAETGIPLSVVFRGIDLKAERHREGKSRRPLRIEFCEGDVLTVFDQWRRAVGVASGAAEDTEGTEAAEEPPGRRPSLSKHLERAIERLSRAMGRQDWPGGLRDSCESVLQDLAELKRSSARARGEAREAAVAALASLDLRLAAAVRASAAESMQADARADAETDLAAYRGRLSAEQWVRSVDVGVDRGLRDRLGLPSLTL
jgi:hypothetical protein